MPKSVQKEQTLLENAVEIYDFLVWVIFKR
jgi:hypothetical protein